MPITNLTKWITIWILNRNSDNLRRWSKVPFNKEMPNAIGTEPFFISSESTLEHWILLIQESIDRRMLHISAKNQGKPNLDGSSPSHKCMINSAVHLQLYRSTIKVSITQVHQSKENKKWTNFMDLTGKKKLNLQIRWEQRRNEVEEIVQIRWIWQD